MGGGGWCGVRCAVVGWSVGGGGSQKAGKVALTPSFVHACACRRDSCHVKKSELRQWCSHSFFSEESSHLHTWVHKKNN